MRGGQWEKLLTPDTAGSDPASGRILWCWALPGCEGWVGLTFYFVIINIDFFVVFNLIIYFNYKRRFSCFPSKHR